MDRQPETTSTQDREPVGAVEKHSRLLREFQVLLPQVKAVSFDVFDTVLQRIVFPKEVFARVEVEAVARFGGGLHGFADKRVQAEADARKRKKKDSGHSEINLEAIYEELLRDNSDWAPWLSELTEMELEQERHCSRTHPLGRRLWQLAQSAGLPICFISDMYLGSTMIEALLEANGYSDSRVICSSDHGCNKSSGGLYQLAARQLGLKPGEILHIGDNARSDQQQAAHSGLKHLPFPAPISPPKKAKYFPKVTTEKNTAAVVAGLIRRENTKPDYPDGSECRQVVKSGMGHRIGYSVFGPMTYGLCHWLADRITGERRDLVLFLGRDGFLPHKILSDWQSRYDYLPDTKLEYFPASRRATALACAAHGVSPLVRDTLGHLRRSVPVRDYFERIGLNPADHLDVIREAGFDSPAAIVHRSGGRPKMEHLIERLESPLKQLGETEKKALLEALRQKGFDQAERPALFDIGWRGTQQACLQSILGNSPELHGYYLSISESLATPGTTTGYLVNDGKPDGLRALFESATPVAELFYSSPEPSFLHYSLDQNKLMPVYDTGNPNGEAIREIQQGAEDFIEEMTDFHEGPKVALPRESAAKNFAKIALEPSEAELAFLQNLIFSDALGREKGQALTAIEPPPLRAFLFDYQKFFAPYSETCWRTHFLQQMSLPAKLWVWPRSPSFRRLWRMVRDWK